MRPPTAISLLYAVTMTNHNNN